MLREGKVLHARIQEHRDINIAIYWVRVEAPLYFIYIYSNGTWGSRVLDDLLD